MMGLVLWYNPGPGVGMIWCEDQGPLAFLGPDVHLPAGLPELSCGSQVEFTYEIRDGVRFVRAITRVSAGPGPTDPREIIAAYERERTDDPVLRVVA